MKLNTNNVKERIKGTFIETLGIEFIETQDTESIEARILIRPDLIQISGVAHGGVLMSFTDTLAGIGSNLLCSNEEYSLGMQVSINMISSGQLNDTLRGKAYIIHKGRSTHVWEVEIISESTKKLIASASVTNMVMKRKTPLNK